MKLGLFGINMGACVDPETAARVAAGAESAGFDSVWTGEHVILPEPQTPDSPIPAHTPLLHPSVALAHVAAHTTRLRLATGIVILPQRNPVVLAKELASLDVICGGRLTFGLGVGYIQKEFAACGIPFAERGPRTDEAIAVLRNLWASEKPKFDGRFFHYSDVDAHPRPIQKPHPPIIIGGMSAPALRRAAKLGDGWYGFALDLDGTTRCLEGLKTARERFGRENPAESFEITVTPSVPIDRDTLARFEDIGVDRIAPIARGDDAEAILQFIEQVADAAA
ncbi:MAG: LLM class F420-dependent oxidoreductase [Myxococcota bacterium]|jgi:probable F420-dependent oxidoreductase|nr:LLM class F420-dependent oxidoreductase [Myxococcota bacterium]